MPVPSQIRKDHGKRQNRHFQFGDAYGHKLSELLPESVCSVAAATCRFYIIGAEAWPGRKTAQCPGEGRTFRTRMMTFGNVPSDNWKTGTTARAKWAQTDSVAGSNDVLDCFGLQMWDVLEHFGNVEPTEIKEIDLLDVIEALRPEIFGKEEN